jgi:hypothetical protein
MSDAGRGVEGSGCRLVWGKIHCERDSAPKNDTRVRRSLVPPLISCSSAPPTLAWQCQSQTESVHSPLLRRVTCLRTPLDILSRTTHHLHGTRDETSTKANPQKWHNMGVTKRKKEMRSPSSLSRLARARPLTYTPARRAWWSRPLQSVRLWGRDTQSGTLAREG